MERTPTATLDPRTSTGIQLAVRTLFSAASFEPPILPAVAVELSAIATDPHAQYSQIERLLESDPMLAVRVLKVAQSPVYAGVAKVTTLRDALVRLGVRLLSDIFLEVSVTTSIFRAPGFEAPMEAVRQHSVLVAHTARAISTALRLPRDGVFLCALLRDVGTAIGLVALASRKIYPRPVPYAEVEASLAEAHEAIGAFVAVKWNLPPDVRRVVSAHHVPPTDLMGSIIALADRIVTAAEQGELSALSDGVECGSVGIGGEQLESVVQQLLRLLPSAPAEPKPAHLPSVSPA